VRASTFVVAVLSFIAGCGFNGVNRLTPDSTASSERAVLIYGVGVAGKWSTPKFGVYLDEYNIRDQRATGNCFVFNRTEALVLSAPGQIEYFAFEVPPGHYVYSPFHTVPVNGEVLAFTATQGRTSYVGTFIYSEDKVVELQRSTRVAEQELPKLFPRLGTRFPLAEAVPVRRPTLFLCTP
jgi:hypothetical protein